MGEELYELPQGWVWTEIETLVESGIQNGIYLPKSKYGSGTPILRIDDFQDGFSRPSNQLNLVRAKPEDIEKYSLNEGDLVINRVNSPSHLGKCLPVRSRNIPALFESNMMRLRLFQAANVFFLAFYLRSHLGKSRLISNAKWAVNQASINQTDVGTTPVPLPPLAEQHRIVAKIEELFTQLDAGVELLKKVKAKLKRYRQAVLKAAVEGDLTKEWREVNQGELEPASVLLDRIVQSVGTIKVRRDVPEDVERTEDVENLKCPDFWKLFSVAELLRKGGLLDIKDGNHGSNHPKSDEFSDQGFPFITAAQVENFKIDYENAPKLQCEVLDRLRVGFSYRGDIILTHKGSVGRVGICTEDCLLSPQTTYYRVNDKFLNKKYLAYFLASPIFQSQLSKIKSQTTRDFVSISKQYKLFLVIPPFFEQQKVVEEVELCLSVIDKLEKTIDTNLKRAEKLRQTILKQAFEGKLVPQDPNEEPAEKLLERIKAEKAKREADKKPKRQSTIKSKQPRKSKTTATQLELKLDD